MMACYLSCQRHACQSTEPVISGVGGPVTHGHDPARRVGDRQASCRVPRSVGVAVAHPGRRSRHGTAVALRVLSQPIERVVAQGDLIDDDPSADRGVVVAGDFPQQPRSVYSTAMRRTAPSMPVPSAVTRS
jgi:hypothetical protein